MSINIKYPCNKWNHKWVFWVLWKKVIFGDKNACLLQAFVILTDLHNSTEKMLSCIAWNPLDEDAGKAMVLFHYVVEMFLFLNIKF